MAIFSLNHWAALWFIPCNSKDRYKKIKNLSPPKLINREYMKLTVPVWFFSLTFSKEHWFWGNYQNCNCSITSYDGQILILTHKDIFKSTKKKKKNISPT